MVENPAVTTPENNIINTNEAGIIPALEGDSNDRDPLNQDSWSINTETQELISQSASIQETPAIEPEETPPSNDSEVQGIKSSV